MSNRQEVSLLTFLKELTKRFNHDETIYMSAQLAFFFLLSLFPFMIFLVTLLGFLPISYEDVLNLVRQYAPGQSISIIEENLSKIVSEQRGGLLSFGLIGTIWSASNGINSIIRALNRAYDVKESRSFFVARGMAILLTFGMILVIVVALLLPVFGKMLGTFIFSFFGLSDTFLMVWNALRWALSFIIMVCVFVFLYWLAPNKRLKFKEVIVGAIFATLGWQLVSLAFSYYVSSFGNYTATYGSLGGIIVLMIWFYLSGMILIIGGQINGMTNIYRRRIT